jgi:hypothetical protein
MVGSSSLPRSAMKKIILPIKKFLQFRQVAEKYRIQFTHGNVKTGIIEVQAKAKDLEIIGY